MAPINPTRAIDYDELADVLYLRLRRSEHTVCEVNDEDIVFVYDEDTRDLIGLDILGFWQRFVREDGTLDEEALRRALVAPFSGMVEEIQRELLPA